MGAGKACVSTPYAYAMEMLEAGRGRLVESSSPEAFAASLTELLRDDDLRRRVGRRAYEFSRTMVWPAVGEKYRGIFDRVGGLDAISRRVREVEASAVNVRAR
jgi:glycosyltransferase involved in cell wall biosynthesis